MNVLNKIIISIAAKSFEVNLPENFDDLKKSVCSSIDILEILKNECFS